MSTLKVDTLQNSVGENLVFGNKNLLINGSQSVWQRSTSTASITTTAYHTADRWETSMSSLGTWTQSRSTDVPSAQGFGYSLKMDCTTADASPAAGDYLIFAQKMEGQNLQHLLKGTSSAKKITVSFWVKSNKTGTYIVRIFDEDNTRQISKSYTISSASTWQKVELTFDGDTTGTLDNDNASSLRIQWWLGTGSTYSSGTLATSWESVTNANMAVGQVNLADSTSNEWYITGVQLEVGSKATDFLFEPFETTLRKCHRYYETSVNYGLDITTQTSGYQESVDWKVGSYHATEGVHYKEPKRDEATITLYNPFNSNTTGQVRQIDASNVGANLSASSRFSRTNWFNIAYGSSGRTAGYTTYNWKADAEL